MRAAITRSPAASKRATIWPMAFFFTASGLMMESVRSTAIYGEPVNGGRAHALHHQAGRGEEERHRPDRCALRGGRAARDRGAHDASLDARSRRLLCSAPATAVLSRSRELH